MPLLASANAAFHRLAGRTPCESYVKTLVISSLVSADQGWIGSVRLT